MSFEPFYISASMYYELWSLDLACVSMSAIEILTLVRHGRVHHFLESVFYDSPLFNGNLASWDVSAVADMQSSESHTLFGLDRNSRGVQCWPAMMCWVVLYYVFAQCSLARHHSTAICPRGTCRL